MATLCWNVLKPAKKQNKDLKKKKKKKKKKKHNNM